MTVVLYKFVGRYECCNVRVV